MTGNPTASLPPTTLRFRLERQADATGVSGTGVVASGVRFPDGTCVVRWRGPIATTTVHDSIASVRAIHGHAGQTTIVWESSPEHGCDGRGTAFVRGAHDCTQDRCENAHLGSVQSGPVAARSENPADWNRPWWIHEDDWAEYVAGYVDSMTSLKSAGWW